MEGGKKKGESFAKAKADKEKADKEAKEAAEKASAAEPVVLEEDDEFEEFEQQEWTAAEQDVEDSQMWQDGWEDDEDDDNFTRQLRAELAASEAGAVKTDAAATTGASAMQE